MPCKGPTIERSVKDVDWEGWGRIENLLKKAERTDFEHGDQHFKRKHAQGLIIICFKTGGRISEVLSLTRDRVSLNAEFWTVTLPLAKKYRKTETVKKWKCTKCSRRWPEKPDTIINSTAVDWKLKCREGGEHKLEEYEGYKARKIEQERMIEFHRDEPLNEKFKKYVESCDNLLFPHHHDSMRPMRRSYAYQIITAVDSDIWPHWFRAQRACQLADELGFDLEERQDWFEWEDDEYPKLYGSRKYEMRDKWREPERRIR